MAYEIRPFTLYWSNVELYEKCPLAFLWSRGWATIDLGSGLGRKKKPPVKDSKHHAMMGLAIGKTVEDFYNQKMYLDPKNLRLRMEDIAEQELQRRLFTEYVDWFRAPKRDVMIKTVRDGAGNFLTTVKRNQLLGPSARAEVSYLGKLDDNTPIGGIADIEFRRVDTGVTLLDGKNSGTKGKYTSPDQLRWYALCYKLVYGVYPDRLGFVYFRYPANEATGESGVDWIDVVPADIEGLASRAVDIFAAMRAEKFEATPSTEACKYCVYESVCPARQEMKAKRVRNKNSDPELDAMFGLGDGMIEIGFGDLHTKPKARSSKKKPT